MPCERRDDERLAGVARPDDEQQRVVADQILRVASSAGQAKAREQEQRQRVPQRMRALCSGHAGAVRRTRRLRSAPAARTAGCRRAGSSRPRSACRCGSSTGTFCRRAVLARGSPASASCCGLMSPSTPTMSNVSSPSMPSDCDAVAALELQRQHAHADEVASDGCARSSARRPPSRRAAACPSPPSRASCRCRIPRRRRRSVGMPCCDVAASPRRRSTSSRRVGWNSVTPPSSRVPSVRRHHQVLDAHVGERAAHHDFVIAAARAVAVEVDRPRRRSPCR